MFGSTLCLFSLKWNALWWCVQCSKLTFDTSVHNPSSCSGVDGILDCFCTVYSRQNKIWLYLPIFGQYTVGKFYCILCKNSRVRNLQQCSTMYCVFSSKLVKDSSSITDGFMQYTSFILHCDATLLSLLDGDTKLQAFHLFHCLISFHRSSNLSLSLFNRLIL